jgi:rhodanese-related sulfurtransferase
MRERQSLILVIGLLIVGLVVSGCSSTEQSEATPDADYTAIIDVRTPAEYAESHVEDAVNIDVQDPSFDAKIAELADDDTYLVYCRSGNRSADAAERLAAAGLDVVDGGGLDAMESAGFPFVRG